MQKRVYLIPMSIVLVLIALFLYGYVFERRRISVEPISIDSDKIKSPVKIVLVSDPHIYRLSSFENRVVQRINALQPDIIAVTGDLFLERELWENRGHDFQTTLAHVCKFMETLKAKSGVYLCRGNNDISNDKEISDLLLDEMNRIKVTVLSNRIERIRVNNNPIALLGIDDPELDEEISDFWVNTDQENQVLQANAKERNSYSHVMRFDEQWENYTLTGQFRQMNPDWSGIGITFYSRMDVGYDHFYRIRRRAGKNEFILAPHNTRVYGTFLQSSVEVKPEVWYHFRINVRNENDYTGIHAKLWPEGEREPNEWMISARDTSSSRLTGGTVGFWSAGQGINQFDNLSVVNQFGDTLASEDFENMLRGAQPRSWIDFSFEQQSVPPMADQVSPSFFKILLAHSPKAFEYSRESSVDLQLSGHTHGGQICLPFIGPLIWRDKIERKYSQGLFHENNTFLYVTRGIGTVYIPFRFFCPPEITVITLR